MDIRNRRALKDAAAEALSCAPNNQKLVLIWAGVSCGLSLLVSVLTFLLDNQIDTTGGLSGIGLRSALSTAQSLLSIASAILIPFWSLGYTGTVLRFARKEPASPATLLDGFRRFGPALRLMLLRYVIFVGLAILCVYVGTTILAMTPLVDPFYSFILENEEALLSGVLDEATMVTMMDAMTPLLIGCLVLYVVVLIPVSYRLRLAELRIMDDPRCGAVAALLENFRLTRGSSLALFRLDLSFWWFYLAHGLILLLNYGDMILPLLGVTLPFNADAALFIFYIAALLAQLVLLYCFSNRVETTYAKFYDTLRTPPMEITVSE